MGDRVTDGAGSYGTVLDVVFYPATPGRPSKTDVTVAWDIGPHTKTVLEPNPEALP